jgi:hypothetical protein
MRALLPRLHAVSYLVKAMSVGEQSRSHGPGRRPFCHLSGARGFIPVLVCLYRRVASGEQKCLLPIHARCPTVRRRCGWAFLDRSTGLELRTSAKSAHLRFPDLTGARVVARYGRKGGECVYYSSPTTKTYSHFCDLTSKLRFATVLHVLRALIFRCALRSARSTNRRA